jgi:hypothetical protein
VNNHVEKASHMNAASGSIVFFGLLLSTSLMVLVKPLINHPLKGWELGPLGTIRSQKPGDPPGLNSEENQKS